MCYGCWIEEGAPKAGKAARAVVPLAQKVYDRSCVGGGLHIVLDDYNVEASHIRWCLKQPDITDDERACGEALLALPYKQRMAAVAHFHGDDALAYPDEIR